MSRRPSVQQNRRAPFRAGTGAAVWTPATEPGLKLWLQSDRGVTQAGTVTGWADQSGNGNNYVNRNTAPAYTASGINGNPDITFTGTELLVGSTAVYSSTAACVMCVFKYASGTQMFGMSFSLNHLVINFPTNKPQVVGPSGGAGTTHQTLVNDGAPHVLIVNWDQAVNGGSLDLYLDNVIASVLGTDVGTIAAGSNDVYAVGGGASTTLQSALWAGVFKAAFWWDHKLSAPALANAWAYGRAIVGI